MLDRLRGVLKLDAIVPVVLIVAALLMTLSTAWRAEMCRSYVMRHVRCVISLSSQ